MICSCGEKMHVSGFIKKREIHRDTITGKPYMIRNAIHVRQPEINNPPRPATHEVVYTIWRCKCGREEWVKQ